MTSKACNEQREGWLVGERVGCDKRIGRNHRVSIKDGGMISRIDWLVC